MQFNLILFIKLIFYYIFKNIKNILKFKFIYIDTYGSDWVGLDWINFQGPSSQSHVTVTPSSQGHSFLVLVYIVQCISGASIRTVHQRGIDPCSASLSLVPESSYFPCTPRSRTCAKPLSTYEDISGQCST